MRLEDGDYEQSSMAQSFLGSVDRTGEQLTAFFSCQEQLMHDTDATSYGSDLGRRRLGNCFIIAATVVFMVSCADAAPKNKNHHKGFKAVKNVGTMCKNTCAKAACLCRNILDSNSTWHLS